MIDCCLHTLNDGYISSFAKKKPSTSQDDDQGEDTSENTDTSKQIRVVNSQNHRLVFLQPEANYWIVAVSPP